MRRNTIFIVLILLVFGIYAAWLNWIITQPGCVDVCASLYRGILNGTAVSPYRYRVLSIFLMSVIGKQPQSDAAIAIAYAITHLVVMPCVIFAYYAALRRWLSPLAAIFGIVIYVLYLPVMYRIYSIGVYSSVELGLLALALWWRRPGLIYGLLIILATLNRETGVLLVLAFAAIHFPRWRERRIQVWTIVYGGLWAAVYVGLRLWRGPAPELESLAVLLDKNLHSWMLPEAISNHFYFLPLYLSVFLMWRKLSPELRRLIIFVVVPYLALTAIFGGWNEVRLLMPVMPFLTVCFILALYQLSRQKVIVELAESP